MAPCDAKELIAKLRLERDVASQSHHEAEVRIQTLLVRMKNVAAWLTNGCSPTHAAEELLEICKESGNGDN